MSRTTWEPKTAVEKTTIQKYRGKPRQWRMDEAVRLVLEENVSQAEAARMCGVSRPKVNGNVIEKRKMLAAQAERAKQSLEERASLTYETVVPDVSDVPVGPEQTEGWNGSAEPAEVVVRESTQLPEADVRVESDTKPPAQEYITESRRVPTFREFNDLYFSNEVCPDCGVHHETPEFHGQIMDLLEDRSKRMKLINCAPYHAKSTTATLKSTLYELVRDPSSRTAVISAAGDLARAFLYQIKQHLQDPDLYIGAARNLIEDWGPFYNPNAWSADQIYIYGRSGAQKDPSVSVYGFGTQIYGRRFDRMIFDDVAVLDNQNTPEAVEKMHRKIWQEYVNRVGKTGQLIWVGTRVAAGDIYSRLDDIEGMNVLRFPCILDEDEQTMLWPEHFPYQAAVAQRSAMSLEQFQLVYQNVDTLGVNASFTPEMLEAARDRERFIGSYDPSWGLVAGLDPAGANDQAGYTALVLMGIDPVTGIRHIVDLVNIKQMKAPDILSQVYDWAERYPLRELRVETNGLQSQLYQWNTELNQRLVNRGVRLVPHITHGRNKWDPQFGVESMAALFHNRLISLPYGDLNSRAKVRELEDQLLGFPMARTSDLVMAMWFASLGCREFATRTQLPAFDPRMKVPGRIANRRRVMNFADREVRAPSRFDLTGELEPSSRDLVKLANMDSSVLVRG
jgi:hypothetical protein